MPNKTSALEWLIIAYHDLKSAQLLYQADHYTDSIGNDLQQSLEKILKSLMAYENKKIKKSHDLIELYVHVNDKINLDFDEELLDIATDYYKEDRYPNPNYTLPPKEEIKDVLDFTEKLFDIVCKTLKIKKEELV